MTNQHLSLGRFAIAGFGLSILTSLFVAAAGAPEPTEAFSPDDVALFIDQYCATCHNETDKEKELDITALKFTPQDAKNLEMWQKIYDQTKSGEMPPKEKRRPREAAVKDFLQKLGDALKAAEAKK